MLWSDTYTSLVSLQPGKYCQVDSDYVMYLTDNWYEVTVEVTLLLLDPVTSNNSYFEQVGSPFPDPLIQADLAVTDIFVDSWPAIGNIYCRITDHGPDALENATEQETLQIGSTRSEVVAVCVVWASS